MIISVEKAWLIEIEILRVKSKIATLKDEDLREIYRETLNELEKLQKNEPVWAAIIFDLDKGDSKEIPNLTYSEAQKIECDLIQFSSDFLHYFAHQPDRNDE